MTTKTYTINDFRFNTYAYKPLEATGYANSRGEYEINDSSILTTLIQEAGRWCESFASDLFLDWTDVKRFVLEDAEPGAAKTFLFGFRQHGVDHDSFILSRFNNYGYSAGLEYRSLWRLDIKVEDKAMTMRLGRVS